VFVLLLVPRQAVIHPGYDTTCADAAVKDSPRLTLNPAGKGRSRGAKKPRRAPNYLALTGFSSRGRAQKRA